MRFLVLGLNHKTAPVEIREKVSFSRDEIVKGLTIAYEYEDILECVILSTCNRTEIYGVIDSKYAADGKTILLKLLEKLSGVDIAQEYLYYHEEEGALSHLFHVASSLDSLVVGEGQILSQVKQAYLTAVQVGTTGTLCNIIFQRAIAIGKRVRTETGIASRPISVSYTAVSLAENYIPNLVNAKVLILGAGEMSELTATHLQSKGVASIFVSNRTFERAQALAEKLGGQAVSFTNFLERAEDADVIITSTGAPHYIITYQAAKELVMKRNGRPIVMIDIAVPRDIDPEVGLLSGVRLFNIDSLESVVEENKKHRLEEAKKAEPLIRDAIDEVLDKLAYLPVRPLMVLISEKAERARQREIHRLMAKMPHVSERDRRLIENMSRLLVRKLLRDPMIRFNEVATNQEDEGQYWAILSEMFKVSETEQEEQEQVIKSYEN